MSPLNQVSPGDNQPCEVQAALQATLDVLSGRWKLSVIGALRLESLRFGQLQRAVSGIGPKMLAQTLQDLETQGMVRRTVHDTRPVTVAYALTDYGRSLLGVIGEMVAWGRVHRARLLLAASSLAPAA